MNASSEKKENFNTNQPCQPCLGDVILIISLLSKWNPKEFSKCPILQLLSSNANTQTRSQDSHPVWKAEFKCTQEGVCQKEEERTREILSKVSWAAQQLTTLILVGEYPAGVPERFCENCHSLEDATQGPGSALVIKPHSQLYTQHNIIKAW